MSKATIITAKEARDHLGDFHDWKDLTEEEQHQAELRNLDHRIRTDMQHRNYLKIGGPLTEKTQQALTEAGYTFIKNPDNGHLASIQW